MAIYWPIKKRPFFAETCKKLDQPGNKEKS
jgi:hypothetical protein